MRQNTSRRTALGTDSNAPTASGGLLKTPASVRRDFAINVLMKVRSDA